MLHLPVLIFVLLGCQCSHLFASICGHNLPESSQAKEFSGCVEALAPLLMSLRKGQLSDEKLIDAARTIAKQIEGCSVFTNGEMNKLRYSESTQELFQYVYGARLNYLDELTNLVQRSNTKKSELSEILEDLKLYFEK